MVYATSVMLPIYMPGDLRNPIIGEAGKKEAPHRGEAGRDGRICARGEGLKPRPARQRRQIGKVRAGLPYPSLNAAGFSSSAGFRMARAYSW